MRNILRLLVGVSATAIVGAGGHFLLTKGPGLLLIALGLALAALTLWPAGRKRVTSMTSVAPLVIVLGFLAVVGSVLVIWPGGVAWGVAGSALAVGAAIAAALLANMKNTA